MKTTEARPSTNGSGPPRRALRLPASRGLRVAIGAATALAIAAVLVAPVLILGGGGGSGSHPCTRTLTYAGTSYAGRAAPQIVQALAIGVGVLRGCSAPPANADLRSLQGIRTGVALGVASDQSTVYVRRGVCVGVPSARLADCLRHAG